MSKPNITIPTSFGGVKADFDNNHLTNGFPQLTPDVLPGDCLNKFIDDTYKGLNGVLELYKGAVLYDVTETYSNTSIVFYIDTNDNNKIKIYHSLQNSNTGNSLSDDTYWEEVQLGGGATRNIGEIIASTIPLTDAGLHLLDGALINGSGIYSAFVDYIADLYDSGDYPDLFETEANWQSAVTTYGVCGKFVYDSVNNTVRLPKYNSKIYTGGGTAPVVGNGISPTMIGLTNGANTNFAYKTGDNYGFSSIISGIPSAQEPIGFTTDPTKSGLIAQLSDITTSLDGYYYIVIATSTKTDIQVDIDEIATDLNGKADVDLTNINPTQNIKDMIVGWGMPDYTAGVVKSWGTVYTAEQNGLISVRGDAGSSEDSALLINNIKIFILASGTNGIAMNFAFVSEGDTYQARGGGGYYPNSRQIIFYPLKGAN